MMTGICHLSLLRGHVIQSSSPTVQTVYCETDTTYIVKCDVNKKNQAKVYKDVGFVDII